MTKDQSLWIFTDDSFMIIDRFTDFLLPITLKTKHFKLIYTYSLYTEIVSTGFMIRFTFLQPKQLPQFSNHDETNLNCSQPNFKFYQDHVLCNLLKQCAGNEDEKDCDFSHKECNGDIFIDNNCFPILDHGHYVSASMFLFSFPSL